MRKIFAILIVGALLGSCVTVRTEPAKEGKKKDWYKNGKAYGDPKGKKKKGKKD